MRDSKPGPKLFLKGSPLGDNKAKEEAESWKKRGLMADGRFAYHPTANILWVPPSLRAPVKTSLLIIKKYKCYFSIASYQLYCDESLEVFQLKTLSCLCINKSYILVWLMSCQTMCWVINAWTIAKGNSLFKEPFVRCNVMSRIGGKVLAKDTSTYHFDICVNLKLYTRQLYKFRLIVQG